MEIMLWMAEAASGAAGPKHVEFWSMAGLSALVSLAALEIVLGIDNVVFLAILTGRLPEEKRGRIRTIGLLLAMVMRLALLGAAFWVMKLQATLFTVPWLEGGIEISGKDLVLIGGGLFLIAKATHEIHHLVEAGGAHEHDPEKRGLGRASATVASVLTQVLLLDLVFSLDSVITAVGMTDNYAVMATAVVASVLVMLFFAKPIGEFVQRHPSMKTLALAFLVLIGVLLVAEGMDQHLKRGYVYFAMAFALVVEVINLRAGHRKGAK
jgi:predicted tellurium resistance membrane protein TerC